MTQFDETTERKGTERWECGTIECIASFKNGRNSTKGSMEEMAAEIYDQPCASPNLEKKQHDKVCWRCRVIARVKANGDWPLGEE